MRVRRLVRRNPSRIADNASHYNERPGDICRGNPRQLSPKWLAALRQHPYYESLTQVRAFRLGYAGFRVWYVLEALDAQGQPRRARVFADWSVDEVLAVEWRRRPKIGWPLELQAL